MSSLRDFVEPRLADGEAIALATVVQTWGILALPARRAMLAATADGLFAGSVSAGCVEAAVVEAAREVVGGGATRRLDIGVADGVAWALGLACGGSMSIVIRSLDGAVWRAAMALRDARRPGVWLLVTHGPAARIGREAVVGAGAAAGDASLVRLAGADASLDDPVAGGREAWSVLAAGPLGAETIAALPLRPAPRLVVVGAGHIAQALAGLAHRLGHAVVVVDHRADFLAPERFPAPSVTLLGRPGARLAELDLDGATAVAVLSHDEAIDDEAVRAALSSPAYFVGALGGRRTRLARRERLLGSGMAEDSLDRLHTPIGLDLGARGPEEIALAVMAQVLAASRGKPAPATP